MFYKIVCLLIAKEIWYYYNTEEFGNGFCNILILIKKLFFCLGKVAVVLLVKNNPQF